MILQTGIPCCLRKASSTRRKRLLRSKASRNVERVGPSSDHKTVSLKPQRKHGPSPSIPGRAVPTSSKEPPSEPVLTGLRRKETTVTPTERPRGNCLPGPFGLVRALVFCVSQVGKSQAGSCYGSFEVEALTSDASDSPKKFMHHSGLSDFGRRIAPEVTSDSDLLGPQNTEAGGSSDHTRL